MGEASKRTSFSCDFNLCINSYEVDRRSGINPNSPEEANYCFFFSINARTFSIVVHLMRKICYQADRLPLAIWILLVCDRSRIRLCSRSPQPAFSSPGRPIRSWWQGSNIELNLEFIRICRSCVPSPSQNLLHYGNLLGQVPDRTWLRRSSNQRFCCPPI